MDGDDRRASQYGPPYQAPGSTRAPTVPSMGPPTTDRYAQPATPVRSDPTRHSMARPYMPGYPGYGYQDQYTASSMHNRSPMQGVELQYSPAYVQEVSRQQALGHPPSHQSYGQFPPGSILPSVQQSSMYDTIPQYQQRQSAAIEVMSSQLGALPQYMQQGEQGSMPVPSASSHYASSQAEQPQYPSAGVARPTLPSQYPSDAAEYQMAESQQPQQGPQRPQPTAAEQETLQADVQQYQQEVTSTFEAILAGRIMEASEKTLQLSRWLVSAVVPLGLHHDDDSRYQERLTLWRHFNICWEALGQKQRHITELALRTGRQPADILSADRIRSMVDELVAMCDQLETYGLVDYEMGIAEEQICEIFTICLDLLLQDHQASSQAGETSQASQARRPT